MSAWQEVVPNQVDTDTWDKQAVLEGVLTKKQDNVGPNESRLYTVETKDKQVAVWGSTVLDSRFDEIAVGCEVRITPLGKVKSEKTGREYADYKVEFRPAPFKEAGEPKLVKPESLKRTTESADRADLPPISAYTDEEPVSLDSIPF